MKIGELPKPDPFWVHPIFLWFPEKMLTNLTSKDLLPCIDAVIDEEENEKRKVKKKPCTGHAKTKRMGNLRAVIGSGGGGTGMPHTGQNYVVSSNLICSKCDREFNSSNPRYLSQLPEIIQSIFPAYVTFNKAICKKVVDEIMTGSRSPSAITNDLNSIINSRYELHHKQYLQLTRHYKDRYLELITFHEVPLHLCFFQLFNVSQNTSDIPGSV